MLLGQGLTLEGVRQKLKEFHDAIGDEGSAEETERQRGKVTHHCSLCPLSYLTLPAACPIPAGRKSEQELRKLLRVPSVSI